MVNEYTILPILAEVLPDYVQSPTTCLRQKVKKPAPNGYTRQALDDARREQVQFDIEFEKDRGRRIKNPDVEALSSLVAPALRYVRAREKLGDASETQVKELDAEMNSAIQALREDITERIKIFSKRYPDSMRHPVVELPNHVETLLEKLRGRLDAPYMGVALRGSTAAGVAR